MFILEHLNQAPQHQNYYKATRCEVGDVRQLIQRLDSVGPPCPPANPQFRTPDQQLPNPLILLNLDVWLRDQRHTWEAARPRQEPL